MTQISRGENNYATETGEASHSIMLLEMPAPGSEATGDDELFTSADLVRALCRLHDADYLREVVRLLQQQLAHAEAGTS